MSYWPIASWVMIALVISSVIGVLVFSPLLANPVYVMAKIDEGTLPGTSLLLMAAILPFMTLAVFFVLFVLVVFTFISIRRERKYLEIINRNRGPEHDEL